MESSVKNLEKPGLEGDVRDEFSFHYQLFFGGAIVLKKGGIPHEKMIEDRNPPKISSGYSDLKIPK